MKRNPVSLGVLMFFIVIVGLLVWMLWIGALTGRAIDGQKSTGDSDEWEILSNSSGFIGLCNEEECMTLPTEIEREGEKWMLGFYKNTGEEQQLGYQNIRGDFMSMEQAFAAE